MRAKTIAALTALLVLAAPVAGAKAHTYKVPASSLQTLSLRGTNGYRLNLTVQQHGTAFLAATDFRFHPALRFVGYSFRRHPHTDPGTLNLNLGDEGSFKAKFVAKSVKREAVSAPCKGEPSVIESGFFVGRFDLDGGGGYTEVHKTRAAGTVTRTAPQICRGPSKGPPRDESGYLGGVEEAEMHELRLIAGRVDGDPLFQAVRYEESAAGESLPPSTIFLGGVTRLSHGIHISSDVVQLRAAASTFQATNPLAPLAGATVAPPFPFSGSATFSLANPPATRWSGNLAVEVPIYGKVALTGPGLASGICTGPGHCTKTLPAKLRPLGSKAVEVQEIR